MKIVIGGQVEKKTIESLIKEIDPSIETVIKSDVEAAMEMKMNRADYYPAACHTRGGGALAIAIDTIGKKQCDTVSILGRQLQEDKIVTAVQEGKIAFGFTGDHVETAVPLINNAIKNN